MEDAVRRRFEKIEATLQWVADEHAAAAVRHKQALERMDRAEERMDRADERMDRADGRMARIEANAQRMEARFEKRMRGFEKLVKIGMREIIELRRLTHQIGEKVDHFVEETEQNIAALIDSQQRTEASLRAFLDSRRTRNGGRSR